MDPQDLTAVQPPSINPAAMEAPSSSPSASDKPDDPLVKTWFARIRSAEKHWRRFHQRVAHNRSLVRGIDETAEPTTSKYNKKRANLIQSTLAVVLSKVYAKNPEMSAAPTNKNRDLRLFCETVSTVTQTMLEDADLKKAAKRSVRAAMTCSFGIVKLQYQKDIRTDPMIQKRIEDSQDNVRHIESLLAQIEGDNAARGDLEAKKRELQEAVQSMEANKEIVAAEGLVMDRVRTERLLIDPAVDDIWDYQQAAWMIEKVPMRKSVAMGAFPSMDLDRATTYKVGDSIKDPNDRKPVFGGGTSTPEDDPLLMVYEAWSKNDNKIYTMVEGLERQFVREPYQPEYSGERWWPYFLLPFSSVDGVFQAQSLVDCLERLEEEHNETRDKYATVRRNIRPHFIVSGDVSDKQITSRIHPELGEIVVVDTAGQPLKDNIQQAAQLTIDPAVFDTGAIQNDWEQVSGLQDAARSVVVTPKTATEASISDQSLAARVAEFRDQIEDWLTEIAQTASELCLLAMTQAQVEQIMGGPEQEPGEMEPPEPTYEWPQNATADQVFNLVQMRVRAGSTAAPNKLRMQENWTKALPLIRDMVNVIRQIDAAGGDSTPERELLEETAARFDESIDVERFMPMKPPPKPAMPAMPAGPGLPGAQPPMPGALPAMPMPGGNPGQPLPALQ